MTEWKYMKVNEAMKDYKDCAVIKISNMYNVLKRGIYRSNEYVGGERL